MKAIFHPEAHEEMIESARFYEEKSEGFGSDLLTAVEETKRRIEQFLRQVQLTERISGSDWYPAFLSSFFTKYSLTAFSSRPSCINIAGLVIGGNAWRRSHQALFF